MRIKLSHRLTFRFAEPVRSLTHILRLTPRSHDGQRVMRWRIDVEPDCRLKAGQDHFGNLTHTLTVAGSIADLRVTVHGEIASFDSAGVVRGAAERMPAELFLRDTPLTTADADLRTFAEEVTASGDDRISKLHLLMEAVHARVTPDATHAPADAPAAAFKAGRGTDADLAHIFIAGARHLGWPARCVTGYYVPEDGESSRRAWAEVEVEHLGWVGFDPVHEICPQDMHIRTAIGLDAIDAAGLRGTRVDGLTETVDATWRFERDRQNSGSTQAQVQAQG